MTIGSGRDLSPERARALASGRVSGSFFGVLTWCFNSRKSGLNLKRQRSRRSRNSISSLRPSHHATGSIHAPFSNITFFQP